MGMNGKCKNATHPHDDMGEGMNGKSKNATHPHDAMNDHARHWTTMPPKHDEVAAARKRLATEIMGEAATKPVKIRGLVCPRWRAEEHPAAHLLREYAETGCPVDVGEDWTLEQLEAAVEKGPHVSALEDAVIALIQVKAREKRRRR